MFNNIQKNFYNTKHIMAKKNSKKGDTRTISSHNNKSIASLGEIILQVIVLRILHLIRRLMVILALNLYFVEIMALKRIALMLVILKILHLIKQIQWLWVVV